MTYRDVARKLSALGCRGIPRKGTGSHRKWHNPATNRSTVVPDTDEEAEDIAFELHFGPLPNPFY